MSDELLGAESALMARECGPHKAASFILRVPIFSE